MATRIHNITDDMVAGEPPFAEILPELLSFLGDRIVVAHNAPFDLGFLRAAMASAGLPPLSNLVLDTVQLSRRVHPASPNHRLDFLCHHHDIFREAGHRALDDALATTELLRILLEAAPSEVLDEYSELVEARA
jgi:DNA polymerase III epsilon subunit family exonuclease